MTPRSAAPMVRNSYSVKWVASSIKIQSYSWPWYSVTAAADCRCPNFTVDPLEKKSIRRVLL